MHSTYIDLIASIERTHRQFLELVKLELDTLAIHDINNVQALILFNIGDREMTVGELIHRGCYLGANLSYNVKAMLDNGYILQERSSHDRRAVHVRLSEKGLALHPKLKSMYGRHISSLVQGALRDEEMVAANRTLRRLERFWIQAAEQGARGNPQASAA